MVLAIESSYSVVWCVVDSHEMQNLGNLLLFVDGRVRCECVSLVFVVFECPYCDGTPS